MGAAPSTPAPPQRLRRSRYPALLSSPRYARLVSPRGGVVHVLGFFPCAPLSEEEAADLVAATAPGALYVDAHPELVRALAADVAAGRSSADGRAWRVPERAPPGFASVAGAGWLVSLNLRNMLADNEMLALLGGEAFGALKAALAAGAAARAPPRVVPFPFEMAYNNGATLARPLDAAALLVGDASVGSTGVTAVVGNPNAWQYASEGAQAVPAVEHAVRLPPAGYFTRDEVAAARAAFRAATNAAAARAGAASLDVDADLQEREAAARARGDAASADLLAERAMAAQALAAAVAWRLQAEADAEVAAAEAAAAAAPPGAPRAAPRPVVAIVNLGGMAALRRNWGAPLAPEAAVPPFTAAQVFFGNAVPAAVLAPVGYGVYRAARRFPRSTGALGAVVGAAVGTVVYTTTYGDWTRYGVAVRTALANPRVTSPLARMNR